VTHEQDEAFDLGDRVAVLERGRLQQVARPDVLYREPVNRFVAGFVGRASTLRGVIEEREEVAVGEDPAGDRVTWPFLVREHFELGASVDVMVRPESLRLVSSDGPDSLSGRTIDCRFSGMVSFVTVELADGQQVEVASSRLVEEAEEVGVALRPEGPPVLAFATEEEE
jgi:ABC-type Fe3+/spermidine/putrescine transport system ATPase subunit